MYSRLKPGHLIRGMGLAEVVEEIVAANKAIVTAKANSDISEIEFLFLFLEGVERHRNTLLG